MEPRSDRGLVLEPRATCGTQENPLGSSLVGGDGVTSLVLSALAWAAGASAPTSHVGYESDFVPIGIVPPCETGPCEQGPRLV